MIPPQNNFSILVRRAKRNLGRSVRSAWHSLTRQAGLIPNEYKSWLIPQTDRSDSAILAKQINDLKPRYGFILVIVVKPGEEKKARRTLKSIMAQLYSSWCVILIQTAAWEPSFQQEVMALQAEGRHLSIVKLSEDTQEDGGLTPKLDELSGEWVGHIHCGSILSIEALAEMALYINGHPETDLVYSDEDFINTQGKHYSPYFKPDWSPDLLLGHNYIGQLIIYRKTLLLEVGGFSGKMSFVDDYDLLLRLTEKTTSIGHIPRILYSQGASEHRNEIEVERLVLDSALKRRGKLASVEAVSGFPGFFRVHWLLSEKPLISIIICTKDRANLVEKCLDSIYVRTNYPNFEVILVDNQSRQKKTLDLINQWREKEPSRFNCLTIDESFNFSALNNQAAQQAKGELILFLNNDTEVLSSDWLQELAGQALRPEIGAVSAMLLFKDGSIQHAGIALGGKQFAVHSHRGLAGDDPGYKGRLLSPSNVSAVTAACMILRKDVFLKAGGFDEHLPYGYNDVELCLKLRRMGYYHVVLPHVKLLHHESQTRGYRFTASKKEQLQREKEYLYNLYPELYNPDPFYDSNLDLLKKDIP